MKVSLLHNIKHQTKKYNTLEKLLTNTKPILERVLYNINHHKQSSQELNTINIDTLYDKNNIR